MRYEIRNFTAADLPWARDLLAQEFGSARVVSRGRLHQADELPGYVAYVDGVGVGLLTYAMNDTDCEVVALACGLRGRGIGSGLLYRATQLARQQGCRRIWLVTTNNNENAIRFYEHRGWRLVAVHAGAVDEGRKLKPEIPLLDSRGVPIRDELEFELDLSGA